jgi:hypothetical protein
MCNIVCQPGLLPPGGGADNPFDTDIAAGGPAGEGWDQWRRERYLLYKLAAYPELAPAGSLMANFQNARSTSTVGKLVGIGLQSAGLFVPLPDNPLAQLGNVTTTQLWEQPIFIALNHYTCPTAR